ncbi:hypothetical protein [Corynebacterium sp. H78]|uniref:hypothetical protein n=1 Tax=Corynebacterium sp. H78 TaxID=3133417 RepID=UPI0030AAA0D3
MGKHSNGKQNYRIAKGPLFGGLAVILVIAIGVSWATIGKDKLEQERALRAQCSQGDMSLIVTTDPAFVGQAQSLVQAYGESRPVVRDHCIRPQIMVTGSAEVVDAIAANAPVPGVWIPADDSFVNDAKQAGTLAIEMHQARLMPEAVGIAMSKSKARKSRSTVTWGDLSTKNLATPGGGDAVTSAVANSHLTSDTDMQEFLSKVHERAYKGGEYTSDSLMQQISSGSTDIEGVPATSSMMQMAGNGLELITPEGSKQLSAPIVTFGSGGMMDELTSRAGADFASFAERHGADGEKSHGATVAGSVKQAVTALNLIKTNPMAIAPGQTGGTSFGAAETPGSTLVLLDASESVDLGAVTAALRPALDKAVEKPTQADAPSSLRRVAVWNYSSPQTDGIYTGVRQNVLFEESASDGLAESHETINHLVPIGDAWLWRSLKTAYDYAVQNHVPEVTNRVVLITSGKDSTGDNATDALSAISQMQNAAHPVRIDVVLLNDDPTGGKLSTVAQQTGGTVTQVTSAAEAGAEGKNTLENAIAKAMGVKN